MHEPTDTPRASAPLPATHTAAPVPDARLHQLRREYDQMLTRYEAQIAEMKARGAPVPDALIDEEADATGEIQDAMAEIPATTLAGALAKLHAACWGGKAYHVEPGAIGTHDELLGSALKDLMRLGPPAPQSVAPQAADAPTACVRLPPDGKYAGAGPAVVSINYARAAPPPAA